MTYGYRHGVEANGLVEYWGDESNWGYVRSNLPLFVSDELRQLIPVELDA